MGGRLRDRRGDERAMAGAVERVPGCRVQLFARTPVGAVRWRLLSSNNREIGRGLSHFPDAETCRLAIKDLQTRLDELDGVVRRASPNIWAWQLLDAGRPVAASAHGYDRQIRCARSLAQFRAGLADALIVAEVMTSHARRWGATLT